MKNSLNILYYSLYIFHNRAHSLFNKINPVLLIYRIPRVRNRLKENLETDNPEEWLDNFWTDKNSGFGQIFIGGWLIGLLYLFLMSFGIIVVEIFNFPFSEYSSYYFFLCGVISYLISYSLVFRNNQYLLYFEKYENFEKKEKTKNFLLSLLTIVGVIALFFVSLLYFY